MAQITLTLNDSSGRAVAQYNLDTAGSALHIPAENGVSYQFTDLATGLGPQNITTAQQGSDLLVSFDSGTDLVIENYFTQGQGALVGVSADGGLTSYPVVAAPEHALASEVAAGQTLGSALNRIHYACGRCLAGYRRQRTDCRCCLHRSSETFRSHNK